MDDRIKGDANVVKGKVEQGLGHATGDAETEAQGHADEARGRGQQVVGDVRQGLHNAGNTIGNDLHKAGQDVDDALHGR